MHGSLRLYDILHRGEQKPPKSNIVPLIGGATPPLSHVANGLYDVGLSFPMRNN